MPFGVAAGKAMSILWKYSNEEGKYALWSLSVENGGEWSYYEYCNLLDGMWS